MEKRILGRTGLEVTVVGFGAMTIGGIFGPVEVAVRFCVSNPHVTVTISGIRTPAQAKANAAAGAPLPVDVLAKLRQFV